MKRTTTVLIVFLVMLFGCSLEQFKKHEMALQLVVRAATGRVLTEKPGWADDCYRITSAAIEMLDQTQEVSLGQLEEYIVTQINWKSLTPEEMDLLRYTIATVRQEVENYLADRGITDPSEQMVQVVAVLTWVNQTAEIRM